jgi:uncharacterized protein DUF4384
MTRPTRLKPHFSATATVTEAVHLLGLLAAAVAAVAAGCASNPKPAAAKPTAEPTAAQPPEPLLPPPATTEPPPPPAPPPDPNRPINVRLQVEAQTRTGLRTVLPDETLHSGDRMAMTFVVDEPAYVYVALAAADGSTQLIFPRPGSDARVSAESPTRVPPVGQWFRLDKSTGQEDLFVYAARDPLSPETLSARLKTDAAKAKDKAKASASSSARKPGDPRRGSSGTSPKPPPRGGTTPPKDPDAPGGLSSANRGMQLEDDPTQVSNGVTSLHFGVKHAK